jgi:hypothetical protein
MMINSAQICSFIIYFFIEIFQINQLHTDLHNSILKNSLFWIPKKCM